MNETTDWTYDLAEHERQQLLRDSRLTFGEKLQWLEDAHKMVLQLAQNAKSSTGNDALTNVSANARNDDKDEKEQATE